jgi:hypothetical protein
MRVLPIRNPDDLPEVAATILRNALADPRAKEVIEALIADQEATRDKLFATAFAMGVVSALGEVMAGHVIGVPSKEN